MKTIVFCSVVCCLLIVACNNKGRTQNNEGKPETEKKISSRDKSINNSNSYSDLFFDSTYLENFIKQKKPDDSIARRIRSFYNTRNYQFAWFSSDGLTEQARGFWNLHDYVTTYDADSSLKNKTLQKKMDELIAEDELSVSASDKSFLNTELILTEHFIMYMLHN